MGLLLLGVQSAAAPLDAAQGQARCEFGMR
ncbi:MAG: hypothetical protein ACI9U2_001332 [Bradymonadia bacterium]|jgi:hypothetical protein